MFYCQIHRVLWLWCRLLVSALCSSGGGSASSTACAEKDQPRRAPAGRADRRRQNDPFSRPEASCAKLTALTKKLCARTALLDRERWLCCALAPILQNRRGRVSAADEEPATRPFDPLERLLPVPANFSTLTAMGLDGPQITATVEREGEVIGSDCDLSAAFHSATDDY